MSISRRISENRATVILIVLVLISLASLGTGAEAAVLGNAVRGAVSVSAYPLWQVLSWTKQTARHTGGFVFDYHSARKEAEELRREVLAYAQRSAEHRELAAENQRLRDMLGFARTESRLEMKPAEVIGRGFDGTLTIDRGTVHGIRESMCVITRDGVVGVVANAEPFFAHVYTLHHSNCRIGAMVMRNRVRGIVRGSGNTMNPVSTMQYVDIKDDIRVGDTLVTSGGSIFPSGYPIGVVAEVAFDSGSLLKTAHVRPAVDPYRLDEVFVLIAAPPSAEELAGTAASNAEESFVYGLPDDRSVQERFAP